MKCDDSFCQAKNAIQIQLFISSSSFGIFGNSLQALANDSTLTGCLKMFIAFPIYLHLVDFCGKC